MKHSSKEVPIKRMALLLIIATISGGVLGCSPSPPTPPCPSTTTCPPNPACPTCPTTMKCPPTPTSPTCPSCPTTTKCPPTPTSPTCPTCPTTMKCPPAPTYPPSTPTVPCPTCPSTTTCPPPPTCPTCPTKSRPQIPTCPTVPSSCPSVPTCPTETSVANSTSSSAGSVFFLAGGHSFADIELYFPTIKTSTCAITPPPINKNFYGHSSFYHDNTIHLCGGINTEFNCVSYSSSMNGWKHHTLSKSKKSGISSVVLKDILYFIGGQDSSNNYLGTHSTPLPLTDQPVLTSVPYLDYKGEDPCSVKVDEENLVIIGGKYNSDYKSSVTLYNVKSSISSSLPSLIQARYYHECAMVEMDNSKWIIVVGGMRSAARRSTEMLELGASTWVSLGDLNEGRIGHGVVASDRGVLAMAGHNNGVYLSSVELLDWTSKQWKVIQPSLKNGRAYFGGAVEIPFSLFCSGCDTSMKVGATVMRNDLDWKWGDQDGGSGKKGKVVSLNGSIKGWIKVKWENQHENQYRWGAEGKNDVKIYCLDGCGTSMAVGSKVVRDDIDWIHGHQDGGRGSIGIIARKEVQKLHVTWDVNGQTHVYRWGKDGKTDVKPYPCVQS